MKLFQPLAELRIGKVIEVAGTSIKVELDQRISELTRTYCGRVYPIGQFASIIKIHFGRDVLLGYVRLLRMRSDIAREEGLPLPNPSDDSRIIEADLFAQVIWDSRTEQLEFSRGVSTYPLPGQGVYLSSQEELSQVYQSAEKGRKPSESGTGSNTSALVQIGTYVGSLGVPCLANMDKLFGMHGAILGSTGAGKSATVASLLHSILEHEIAPGQVMKPKVVLIDPHGEYAKAFGKKCVVFRAYSQPTGTEEASNVRHLELPYWMLSGEEFRELAIGKSQWEATSENNIVYKALRHSRMEKLGWIEAAKTDWEGKSCSGKDPEEDRPITSVNQVAERIAAYDRDTPHPFSLDEFERHIENEQSMRRNRNATWEKMSPSDFKPYASVLDKLNVLRTDPRLTFLMKEFKAGDKDLPEILAQFIGPVGSDECSVRIIDISGIPNEVAGPLTAAIARLLFQYKVWQSRSEREKDPILLVCEEAHRYVPDAGQAEYESAQKAIRRLAKEGRKYGVGLLLVSQRPADVEKTVLSQCNSWIVLRLTNSADQEQVARMLPDSLSGLAKMLPSLSRREALFVGEAAAMPARIFIRELSDDQLPDSCDIAFSVGWKEDVSTLEILKQVVDRWRKET